MPSLLILGGLTVDRFPDGRRAPGGSVLHAGLAAAAEGLAVATLTVAGPEPEAAAGLSRLGQLGDVHRRAAHATTTYRHEEAGGRRVLVYERAGGAIDPAALDGVVTPDVVLLAPIADELPLATLAAVRERLRPPCSVLLIQGWLRRLALGEPVHPLALDELPDDLWKAFGTADALVVSTEDLAEAPVDPFTQAREVRSRVGSRPVLVLTLGERGYLLDDPDSDRIAAVVPRRIVDGVPLVGAGDTFGASLAVHLAGGLEPPQAAAAAAERVIAVLESRR